MAQTMTASRTTVYHKTSYPSSSSASADMHHHKPNSWHPPPSHIHPLQTTHIPPVSSSSAVNNTASTANRTNQANGTSINGHVPGSRTASNRTRPKSDFYKNGHPAEVIVIDSESPAPPSASSTGPKRKRHDSISASTTVSVATTKRPRTTLNETHETTRVSHRNKSHSVTWTRDVRGIYRAQQVFVPKVDDVCVVLGIY
jgi:hypothetical protein